MNRKLQEELIAPCGMNCGVCMGYLREKNRCPGCRDNNTEKPISRLRCKVINCETIANSKSKFCFECEKRCDRLKQLDKRYRTKYHMSMIENLEFIRDHGMNEFLRWQTSKYKCPACGGVISTHNGRCYRCQHVEIWK